MDIPITPNRFNSSSSKVTPKSYELVESPALVPKHPLGVRPFGNQFLASTDAKYSAGLYQMLPEDLLANLLELFNPNSLLMLGSTCKYLHAFCRWDNLWRALFIESQNSKDFAFKWLGTWRSTYLNLGSEVESKPNCDNVFSDILYRMFFCAHIPLEAYASNIPQKNRITRLKDMSLEDYSKSWNKKPFILTQNIQEWPIYKSWDIEYLLHQFHQVKFRAEGVKWKLCDYIEYIENNCDESPLYLFDKNFFKKMNLIIDETGSSSSYSIPECFTEDLFSVFDGQRPDFRWLIIGPKRSGSTYHKDPNATSAWNAVIRGSKYWIMFPSTASYPAPPGVYVSEDESEVTSPLSVTEWLLGFHAEARNTPGCIEAICGEGEILHVPSGWWHLVVNLETTTAITQNFVPQIQLPEVLHFLEHKSEQVSGFKKGIESPFHLFTERIRAIYPDLMHNISCDLERLRFLTSLASKMKKKFHNYKIV